MQVFSVSRDHFEQIVLLSFLNLKALRYQATVIRVMSFAKNLTAKCNSKYRNITQNSIYQNISGIQKLKASFKACFCKGLAPKHIRDKRRGRN